MSVLYGLHCDVCPAHFDKHHYLNIRGVRTMAIKAGWTNPARGRDLCPACSEARAARAKKENPNGYL